MLGKWRGRNGFEERGNYGIDAVYLEKRQKVILLQSGARILLSIESLFIYHVVTILQNRVQGKCFVMLNSQRRHFVRGGNSFYLLVEGLGSLFSYGMSVHMAVVVHDK